MDAVTGKIAWLAAAFAFAPLAHADEGETWAVDRAGFYIGSYTNDLRLRGRVDGTVEAQGTLLDGTVVDFDKEFDFGGTHQLLAFGGSWRPFERHQFSFDYHRDTRQGSRRLQRDIVYAGETFPVDAQVDARFRAQVYDVRYTYYPWLTQADALGISLGVVDYRVDLRLRGQGAVAGMTGTRTLEEDADSHLPAPLLGLSYRHAFSPQWRFFADAAYFKAKIHHIDGDVTDLHAGIEYYPWQHVGFAALYSVYQIDANISRHNLDGQLDLKSSGFQLQLRVR